MVAEAEAYSRPRRNFMQAVVRFREAGIILIILVLSALVSLRTRLPHRR